MKRATMLIANNKGYFFLAIAISAVSFVAFNISDQLLFFIPIPYFYLPYDSIPQFILSVVTSLIMGLIVSMNIFVLKTKIGNKISASLFSGSALGVVSGACASCTSLGFLLVSAFGGTGIVASNFVSNYQTPLRLLSIGLMIWAYISVSNRMTRSCLIR
jgi:hypothetical protein